MKLPINLLIIFLIPLLTITPVSSKFNFFMEYCENDVGNYTKGSTYKENLNLLLPNLTNKASSAIFATHTVGEGIEKTYGLYMCRGDLDDQQCQDCITFASLSIIEKCPVQKEAIVWFQECMVRYANRSIFSLKEEDPVSYSWSDTNVSDPVEFGKIISTTVDGLIAQAAYNTSRGGYATDHANVTLFEEVYVLAQCTPDILGSRCERCLRSAFRNMGACCGTARMRLAMYLPSCWLRYSQAPFVEAFDKGIGSDTPKSSSQSGPQLKFPPLPNDLPEPPPSAERSKATISTLGGINFMFGLVMTSIVSLFMAW